MDVRLSDGYTLFVEEVGSGFPVFVLHGGPGLDHRHFRPWLDPLADEFRLLYVDERGQGRSERVEPASLSLDVFAQDVDLAAEALGLDAFALLGHSFGAIIATRHAIELGTAAGYVISGGGDSSAALGQDVAASLEAMGEAGKPIAESWEREQTVETEEEFRELMRVQWPFHFAGPLPEGFRDETIYTPEVIRHFATAGYGNFDYVPDLRRIHRPTLVLVGEEDRTTTARAARVLHEGIAGSELTVIPAVGHMSFVEAPDAYLGAVRPFLRRVAAAAATVLIVALAAAASTQAKAPRPPVQVVANEPALLESVDGEVISCAASLDEQQRPRMACGVVDFREGLVLGPKPGAYYARIGADGLTVLQGGVAPSSPEARYNAPEPAGTSKSTQLRRASYRILDLRYGRRYAFSGTRVGCTVSKNETAVTCNVVDARFRPLRGSYGFTLGFQSLVVKRIVTSGASAIVFAARHGEA